MNPQTIHGETLAEAIVANLDIESLPIFRAEGVTVEMGDYEWSNGHLLGIVVGEERFTLSLAKVGDSATSPAERALAAIAALLSAADKITIGEIVDHLETNHRLAADLGWIRRQLPSLGWEAHRKPNSGVIAWRRRCDPVRELAPGERA